MAKPKQKTTRPHGKPAGRARLKTALQNIQGNASVGMIDTYKMKDDDTKLTSVAYSKAIWPGVDRRTWQGQRLHSNFHDLVQDLGGPDEISTMLKALVKEVAIMMTISDDFIRMQHDEDKEVRDGYDFLEHMTLIRTLNSVLKSVGLERRMKTIEKKKLEDVITIDGKSQRLP